MFNFKILAASIEARERGGWVKEYIFWLPTDECVCARTAPVSRKRSASFSLQSRQTYKSQLKCQIKNLYFQKVIVI